MALTIAYPPNFERLWSEYPKWPAGRSVKKQSYDTYVKVDKLLHFTDADIEHIFTDIRNRKLNCETWQPEYRSPRDGRAVGPPMFSTYFNRHLWGEPYVKKGSQRPSNGAHRDFPPEAPAWQQQGYASEAAFRAAVDRAFEEAKRKGMGLH